jgi:glycosyltransferase involved in cell wall biosynthesis
MKIVHISTYASGGGAAIATYRIHKKLLEKGYDSNLIVLKEPHIPLQKVSTFKSSRWLRIRNYFLIRLEQFLLKSYLYSTPFSFNYLSKYPLQKNILLKSADVVCLYWVGHNFLTSSQIAAINKPIVWRLSDKWAFTGGCHLPGTCNRYEVSCGECPQLKSSNTKDITYKIWKRKSKDWKSKDFAIVAPSSWMQKSAQKSSLFKNKRILKIPTGIDHSIFKPTNKRVAREILNIPLYSKVVLFGAMHAMETAYKGIHIFNKIKDMLDDNYRFVVFGSNKTANSSLDESDQLQFLGLMQDEISLSLAYNAADVFISPSLEDNLPNTVLEAMACGTPCVAFRTSGGVVDVIEHLKNGYLAETNNVMDLVRGILWVLETNGNGDISLKTRERILSDFTLDKQVDRYIDLYNSLLSDYAQRTK